MTGHKAMETDLFRSLPLRERGFAIEPEIAARVLKAGERIHEVPIHYHARSREAGKKLTTLDGLRVLRTLVRCRGDVTRALVVGAYRSSSGSIHTVGRISRGSAAAIAATRSRRVVDSHQL